LCGLQRKGYPKKSKTFGKEAIPIKIVMWSPTAFGGRKSANLLLFALQAAAAGEGEQLIIHVDPEGSGPEHFLLSGSHRRRMMSEKEFGVEFLANLLRCERFSKEQVITAAYTFAEGKLHVLPPGRKEFYEHDTGNTADLISKILKSTDEVFRHVWIELPAGESLFADRILSEADCVIFNLAQSPAEIGKLKEMQQLKNVFYLVGAYEQRNILSVHNLELLYPMLRGRCGCIPYCSEFMAACCTGDAEAFRMRGAGQKDMKEITAFFCAVEKAYDSWKVRCGTYIHE